MFQQIADILFQTNCVEAMFMSFGNYFCEKLKLNDATFGIGQVWGKKKSQKKL
jgi:hypothetical protein